MPTPALSAMEAQSTPHRSHRLTSTANDDELVLSDELSLRVSMGALVIRKP